MYKLFIYNGIKQVSRSNSAIKIQAERKLDEWTASCLFSLTIFLGKKMQVFIT